MIINNVLTDKIRQYLLSELEEISAYEEYHNFNELLHDDELVKLLEYPNYEIYNE